AALAQSILYFNFLSTEFNPNVLQLLLWALGGYAFAHALIKQKWKYWLLLGVFFALGFYAKYSMAVLAASFGLFLLADSEARKNLLKPGPYAALGVCVGLLAPHLQWLVHHDFQPFTYASERTETAKDLGQHFLFPFKFSLSQMVDFLPA